MSQEIMFPHRSNPGLAFDHGWEGPYSILEGLRNLNPDRTVTFAVAERSGSVVWHVTTILWVPPVDQVEFGLDLYYGPGQVPIPHWRYMGDGSTTVGGPDSRDLISGCVEEAALKLCSHLYGIVDRMSRIPGNVPSVFRVVDGAVLPDISPVAA